MEIWIVKVREKEDKSGAATLYFNVCAQEGELNVISCGWRLTGGAILGPSYNVRGTFHPAFYAGRELQILVYHKIKELAAKYPKVKPPVDMANAVYSWALNPEVFRRNAPELFGEEGAEAII